MRFLSYHNTHAGVHLQFISTVLLNLPFAVGYMGNTTCIPVSRIALFGVIQELRYCIMVLDTVVESWHKQLNLKYLAPSCYI